MHRQPSPNQEETVKVDLKAIILHNTGGSPQIVRFAITTEMLKFIDIVPFFEAKTSFSNKKLTLGFDLLTYVVFV